MYALAANRLIRAAAEPSKEGKNKYKVLYAIHEEAGAETAQMKQKKNYR